VLFAKIGDLPTKLFVNCISTAEDTSTDLYPDRPFYVDQCRVYEFLLDGLDVGIMESSAYKPLQRTDGVLEIGYLLCFGRFSNGSLLGAKSDKRANAEKNLGYGIVLTLWRATYGVARLDTSLVMMSIPRCLATPIYTISDAETHTYQNRLTSRDENQILGVPCLLRCQNLCLRQPLRLLSG
jgi:hypothetical protein